MVQSLSEGIEELSEEVGELGLDSDTALINKSDADSSSSDKVRGVGTMVPACSVKF